MTVDTQHLENLLPETREALQGTVEERIAFLKADKFIPYPAADNITLKLEELLVEPKKTRMPCLLIVGESNNGKTSLVRYFYRAHMPTDGIDRAAVPVVSVLAPSGPDVAQFYDKILNRLLIPFKKSSSLSSKENDIYYHFNSLGVKILVIDEIHNILSGSTAKQKTFMNAVKNISNELMIPIVLVGIKDALHATETDVQISSRFRPMLLPLWKIDKDYVSLLLSVEQTLPLKRPSNLYRDKKVAEAIMDLSEGLIGEIVGLIKDSAIRALKDGRESITIDDIEFCGSKPSQRRSMQMVESAVA